MGVLTRAEQWVLTLYCRLWSRWKAAEETLMQEGSTYTLKDSKGEVRYIGQRPEVAIARNLAQQLARLGAELGLSPSARTRIEAKPPEDKAVDDKRKFFGVVG
jgi:P27 family predicted phage terminase small subunit